MTKRTHKDYTQLIEELMDGSTTKLDANVAVDILLRLDCKDVTRSTDREVKKSHIVTRRRPSRDSHIASHARFFSHPAIDANELNHATLRINMSHPLTAEMLNTFKDALLEIYDANPDEFDQRIAGTFKKAQSNWVEGITTDAGAQHPLR